MIYKLSAVFLREVEVPAALSIPLFFRDLETIGRTYSDEKERHLSCTRLVQTLIANPFQRQHISSSLSRFREQFRTIAGTFLEPDHVESVLKDVLDSILCDASSVLLISSEEFNQLLHPPKYNLTLTLPHMGGHESSSIPSVMALSSTALVRIHHSCGIWATSLGNPGDNYGLGFIEPVLAAGCADEVVYVLCGRTLYSVSKPKDGKPVIKQTIAELYPKWQPPPVLASLTVIPSDPDSLLSPKLPLTHSLMMSLSTVDGNTCNTALALVTPAGVDLSFFVKWRAIRGAVTPNGHEVWFIVENGQKTSLASKMLVGPNQEPRVYSLPKDERPMLVACSRDGRSVCVITIEGSVLLLSIKAQEFLRRELQSAVGLARTLVSVKGGFMIVNELRGGRYSNDTNVFFLSSNLEEKKIDVTPFLKGVSQICVSDDDGSRIGLCTQGGVEIYSYFPGSLLSRFQSWLSSPESFSTVDEAILNNLVQSPHFFDALKSQASLFSELMRFAPFQKAFLTHFPNIASQLDPLLKDFYTQALLAQDLCTTPE